MYIVNYELILKYMVTIYHYNYQSECENGLGSHVI